MRKKMLFLVLASTFLIALNVKAQSPIYKGDKQVNVGLGLSGWGIPVFAGMDFCVADNFTVGGELSYRNYRDRWGGYDWHHNVFGIVANGNYHFTDILMIPEKWDVYAGANLGFYVFNTYDGPDNDLDYDGSGVSGLGLGLQVGGRYYFNEKLGVMLEFSGGNAVADGKVGLSIKL